MDPERRILLVEDEPDILVSLKDIVEMQVPGARVATALDGPAALKILPVFRPHLIVTDFKMPGMDGLAFLAAAHRAAPGTPAVLMTAYPDVELAARAVNDAHVATFLAKPVDPDAMVDSLIELLRAQEAELENARSLARGLRAMKDALDAASR